MGKVLSISTSTDEIRFKHPTYVTNSTGASPKKRQKLDKTKLEAQWHDALSRLVHDMEENDMPSFVFLASVRHVEPLSLSPQWNQTKGKAKVASEDKLSSDLPWNPPPPDDSLRIPGELILARDTKHSSKYWPAQILNYIPPSAPRKRPLYEIQWMDNNKKSIEREQFYSYEESGFGTCTLGKFESVYEDVVNDTDDDDAPESLRGPSPEPCDPPPTGPAFCELSVHEQFVYTRPVIHAILRDEYPPARAAHAKFIGGGKGRETLTKNAGERGLMDPREVERFHKLLEEWCMGRTRKGGRYPANDVHLEEEVVAGPAAEANNVVLAKNGESAFNDNAEAVIIALDAARDGDNEISAAEANNVVLEKNGESAFKDNAEAVVIAFDAAVDSANEVVPLDSEELRFDQTSDTTSTLSEASDVSDLMSSAMPTRQVGCAAYEGLSMVEKFDYCVNVLLPELLIQIHVWRMGERASMALLDEGEERRLHDLGTAEKKKTDWVFDVKRLRAAKERELVNEERKRQTVVGSTSRPKRASRR
ncbi:hypothetical protein GGX14DRAFT_517709 [Mycena pura]|uniref:PWWP domain-containing protein n=1 Tax=Mycena pura TaxID=153505 RepID=A0AAD6VLR0_9AGAR|nr:hypothetical protein GGX14DRAFT_517709 [Mycena pura]